MIAHCVSARSRHAQPSRLTLTLGASTSATPISVGKDQCPVRETTLPQPAVMVNARPCGMEVQQGCSVDGRGSCAFVHAGRIERVAVEGEAAAGSMVSAAAVRF